MSSGGNKTRPVASNGFYSYFEKKRDICYQWRWRNSKGFCKSESKNCYKKLLSIKTGTKLKFEHHVKMLFKKATQKINALAIELPYMTFQQRKLIFNFFLISHFSYWPIVWIFHNRRLNNDINNIREKALRIIYQNYATSFTDLPARDNSLTTHYV